MRGHFRYIGAGELAADDDLVRPCPVEVATDLVELAEEVADVLLGRVENGRERSGKHLNHSCSFFFAGNGNGNGTGGRENESDITGYRERNISVGNMWITIGKR